MSDKPRRVVLLSTPTGGDLLLSGVRWRDGEPVSGYVENGDWTWKREGEEELAEDGGGHVVNRWPAREYAWVAAPEGGNYNDIIQKAREAKTPQG